MSGRQDKKSRRLQRAIAKDVDRATKKIEQAKLDNSVVIIQKYNQYLKSMNFWKKCKFCFGLFFR